MPKTDQTIFLDANIFNYLIRIFPQKGVPLPGRIVTFVPDNADKFIYYRSGSAIHTKAALACFQGDNFFPETYFFGEKTPRDADDATFFMKKYTSDNSEDIHVMKGADLPPLVPNGHLIQREVPPELYKGRKFDIRVLTCARRTGEIMIYKNLLYRVNPNQYDANAIDGAHQFTIAAATNSYASFFEDVRPNEMPLEAYLQQLQDIVPKIYEKIIAIANKGYAGPPLDKTFIIGGLDFMPEQGTNDLKFLEFNGTPGFNIHLGIENWQRFYVRVMEFMRGENPNTDDCIYLKP